MGHTKREDGGAGRERRRFTLDSVPSYPIRAFHAVTETSYKIGGVDDGT